MKEEPSLRFFQRCKNAACTENYVWYNCTIYHYEEPQSLSEGMKGVILYTRVKNSSVCNHVMDTHPSEHKAFTRFYDRKIRCEREDTLMVEGSSHLGRMVEDSD